MSRSGFIKEKYQATCSNINYAWSFINEGQKSIIFGAWDDTIENGRQLILSDDWAVRRDRRQPGYMKSMEHIDKILSEGFRLFTFKMTRAKTTGDGPARVKNFETTIYEKRLLIEKPLYYAVALNAETRESDTAWPEYLEGAQRETVQTVTERNPEARRACLKEFGYACSICGFDFLATYGEIGKGYIHVHHLSLVSGPKKRHTVNPIRDLRPVCPNCHAMIHKRMPHFEIDELKQIIRQTRESDLT